MGLYSIYVEDWLDVYRREQFYFVKLEEFSESPQEHANRIFKFLNLGKLVVVLVVIDRHNRVQKNTITYSLKTLFYL